MKYLVLLCLLITQFGVIEVSSWCLKASVELDAEVTKLDASQDGKYVVAASDKDNGSDKLYIYDADTLTLITTLNFGGKDITTARFSKDSQYIGVGFKNGHAYLISGQAPFSSTALESYNPFGDDIAQIDFNWNNDKLILCGDDTDGVELITNYGQVSQTQTNLNYDVNINCKFSKDDDIILIQSDKDVVAYSSDGTQTMFNRMWGLYRDLAVRPTTGTPKFITAGMTDGNSWRWMANSNAGTANSYSGSNPWGPLNCACYSQSSTPLYYAVGSSGGDKSVFIYNEATNIIDEQLTTHYESIKSCSWSYDDNSLYVGTTENSGKAVIYKYMTSCVWTAGQCPKGYYFISTNQSCNFCYLAITACQTCTTISNCLTCNEGYYLKSATECSPCTSDIEGCFSCDNSTYCNGCISGYYLLANYSCGRCNAAFSNCGICVNSTSCSMCYSDFYYNQTLNTCVKCDTNISHCTHCTNDSFCISCESGYYGQNCDPCDNNCTHCHTTSNNCTGCFRGYYLLGDVCTACNQECLSCNSSTYCQYCTNGYFSNSGACTICTQPCLTCNSTSTTCTTCTLGYYISGSTCLKCLDNCSSCQNSTNCQSCLPGFYMYSSSCLICADLFDNCDNCDNSSCWNCLVGFYRNSTANCSSCNQISGCLQCQNSSFCMYCNSGYYLSSGNCLKCIDNCQFCSSPTICNGCTIGYYLSSTSCLVCPQDCLSCSNTTFCISCEMHFYLDSTNSCVSCNSAMSGCLTCLNDTFCGECQVGLFLFNQTTCQLCSAPCVTCSNNTKCLSCELGYYLDASNDCLPCPSSCAQCTSESSCQICTVGHYHNSSNHTCQLCETSFNGCTSCNISICFTCSLGYFNNASSGSCQKCHSYINKCETCINQTICDICSLGFYLDTTTNQSCLPCPEVLAGCDSCQNGTYCSSCTNGFYWSTGICVSCLPQCRTCTNSSSCLDCTSGYILNTTSTDCVFCEAYLIGCLFCDTTLTCSQCQVSFYLDANQCLHCRSAMHGCHDCTSGNNCSSCHQGFYLNSSYLCSTCSSAIVGCQWCNSSTICVECQSGYALVNDTCLLCVSSLVGCIHCSNDTSCDKCQSGYYLNTSNSQCFLCINQLQGCIFCQTDTKCLQCQGGYYLDSTTFNCLVCNNSGCQSCEETNSTRCLSCNSGYYLNSATCISCGDGCNLCDNGTSCQQCLTGYSLNSSTLACDSCREVIGGCSKCHNSTYCFQCNSLYFLNSDSCTICSSVMIGCQFCSNSSSCLFCNTGYYLNSSSLCQSCIQIDGCLACSNQSSCLFCEHGYYLQSGTCLNCNSISNCYDCTNSTTCVLCQSGYVISDGGICQFVEISGYSSSQDDPNLDFKTYYLDQNTLKHILFAKGYTYTQSNEDWNTTTQLIIYDNLNQYSLTIKRVQWGSNGYTLIFYTNNPIEISSSSMPFARLLASQNTNINYNSKIKMQGSSLSTILPNLVHQGNLQKKYDMDSPQFYISYVNKVYNFYYYIIGIVITCLLFINFAVKACLTPHSKDHGQIIGHIFCLKAVPIVMYPTFAEYINFSYGFMTGDAPWANHVIAEWLSDFSDEVPYGYLVYFGNMNIASTYFIALLLFMALMGFYALIIWNSDNTQSPKETQKKDAYFQLIYNWFILGLIFSGCAAVQGAILNPMNQLTINGLFYILGIVVYCITSVHILYSLITKQKINRLRMFMKGTLLSIGHLNPIYLMAAIVVLDGLCILTEYFYRKGRLDCPKCWIASNLLSTLALAFYFYLPNTLLTIIFVSFMVTIILFIEIFAHVTQRGMKSKAYSSNPQYSIVSKKSSNQIINQSHINLSKDIEIELDSDQGGFDTTIGKTFKTMKASQKTRKRKFNQRTSDNNFSTIDSSL